MKNFCKLFVILVVAALASHATSPSVAVDAQSIKNKRNTVTRIEYFGCKRIEKETVESYLPLRVGDEYDDYSINEALKSLHSTGFYEEVNIEVKGDVLAVHVKEYPIINKISFEGNSKISDRELKNVIKLKAREVLSPAKIREIQHGLLETYRKMSRYNASVTPKIIKLDNNRVNLVFEINEGNAAGIRSIEFIGNKNFSSGELRDVISTRIKRWYRFFVNDDIYDSDRVSEDRALISRFYKEHGYADIKILSSTAELSSSKNGFDLTFVIDEGEVYRIGEIKIISHIKKLDVDGMTDGFYCKSGDVYNIVLVEADFADLVKKIGTKGFPSVKILPEVKKDDAKKSLSIVYHVAEGDKTYISKIVIKGNSRTREHVIRREINIHEGDALNDTLVSMSENNIRSLGFFKKVDVSVVPEDNADDKCVMQVEVEEQSTGEAVLSGSYSTASGFGLEMGYNERNFFGSGKSIGVSLNSGRARAGNSYEIGKDGRETKVERRKAKFKFLNNVVVSASDPHFLDKDLDGSLSFYRYNSSRYDNFSTQELGSTVGISYAISQKIRQGWDYTISNRKFSDVYSKASPIVKYQTMKHGSDGSVSETRTGKSVLSSIKHNISYGTSFLTGLKGSFRTGLGTTFAGLGGDAKHFKNELYAVYVMPVFKKTTLKFGGTFGLLTKAGGKDDPLIIDGFALGLDSFRGFDDCGFGPVAETTRSDVASYKDIISVTKKRVYREYIGASKYWKGTVEFKFPIGLPEELQFRGFVFTDFGTAWDAPSKGDKFIKKQSAEEFSKNNSGKILSAGIRADIANNKEFASCSFDEKVIAHRIIDTKKIRASIGFGISFITPFGPMVFTYAIPVRKEKHDETQRFLVGFSTKF